MRRTVRAAALALTVSVLAIPSIPARASGAPPAGVEAIKIAARRIVTDHNFPAAFTFAPNGSIFFANRFGGVIRQRLKNGTTRSVYTVTNLSTDGEQGLLGIALDPGWPASPYIYAYATRNDPGLVNEILKITVAGGVGTGSIVIWTSQTTPGTYHDGGHILFGPDGKLYGQVGEAHDSSNAQDLTTDAGKILRMNSDGTVPGDNPLGGRIFTRGIRNGFGFAFDPAKHVLWETENGPECNDELNQFDNGDNGGWGPNENCNGTSPNDTNNSGPTPRTFPLKWFTPTIAPTGMVFCPVNGCGLTGHGGHLFFGAWNDGIIREATLTANRLGVLSLAKVLDRTGGILSMERNPVNHHLYFSDPNGIYELVPA